MKVKIPFEDLTTAEDRLDVAELYRNVKVIYSPNIVEIAFG